MSNNPNNPFDTNQPNQGYAQGGAPPKKSNTWLWVLGILGALGVVGALVCCGGGYAIFSFSTGVLADAVKSALVDNPVIDEHIGDIQSLDFSITKTAEHAQGRQDVMAFDIEGAKGSGVLVVKGIQKGGDPSQVNTGTAELIMSDGTRHSVEMSEDGDPLDENFKIDLGDALNEPAESL